MEKKVSVKDIYKYAEGDIPLVYNKLKSVLGPEMPFAKFQIGAGVYVWSDSSDKWQVLSAADPVEQSMVNAKLEEIRSRITPKVGAKTAERIFTVPDDSYIWFDDSEGEMKLMLTGWGFKKPVRVSGGGEKGKVSVSRPVSVSFLYDGEKLKNYDFGLQLPKQLKKLTTDAEGNYKFSSLNVGASYHLKELESPHREFTLTVVDGVNHYDFDLTLHTDIKVSVLLDSNPVENEPVEIYVGARKFNLATDAEGKVSLNLPYHENELIKVAVRDKEMKQELASKSNEFVFEFATPKIIPDPEPPKPDEKIIDIKEKEKDVIVKPLPDGGGDVIDVVKPINDIRVTFLDKKGNPIKCHSVTFRQYGMTDCICGLNDQGLTSFPETAFKQGSPISVDINSWKQPGDKTTFTFLLENNEYDYVLQEEAGKSGKGNLLWPILGAIAGLILLLALWPFWEGFFSRLFESIYY